MVSSDAVRRMLWLPLKLSLQRPLNVFDLAVKHSNILGNEVTGSEMSVDKFLYCKVYTRPNHENVFSVAGSRCVSVM